MFVILPKKIKLLANRETGLTQINGIITPNKVVEDQVIFIQNIIFIFEAENNKSDSIWKF